jgi:hypothetical protein
MALPAFADDFDKTGVSVTASKGDLSFGYATGTHADFADGADVFSLGTSGPVANVGLQFISNGSTDDYRLNLSKRADLTLINLNLYGVAEAHYDFGDSFAKDRLVLSPYVGIEAPVFGVTPYVEVGYDVSSLEGDYLDFNNQDSYAAVGARVAINESVELNAQILQKMDTDFDSTDREFVVGFNIKL